MKKRIWTVFLIAVMVFTLTGCKMNDFRSAVSMTESGNWGDAREIFSALGSYKDSAELVSECDYNIAMAAMESADYASAISTLEALDGYRDAQAQLTECRYRYAEALCENGKFDEALAIFEELGEYGDYEAFRADVDNEIQKLTEALGGDEGNKSARFDYDGYDCAAALFSFPEIKQYVFSITIPELVGEK